MEGDHQGGRGRQKEDGELKGAAGRMPRDTCHPKFTPHWASFTQNSRASLQVFSSQEPRVQLPFRLSFLPEALSALAQQQCQALKVSRDGAVLHSRMENNQASGEGASTFF
jgi:hypothetical protein